MTEHFWVGDRILAGPRGCREADGPARRPPLAVIASRAGRPGAARRPRGERPSTPSCRDLLPPPARLIIYGGVFLLGYLLANIVSAWERQRFVESVLASNGFVAVLRLGLADELDRLQRDLAAVGAPLEAVRAKSEQAGRAARATIRAQLVSAARRVATIKARYGNTPGRGRHARVGSLRDKLEQARPRSAAQPAGLAARPDTASRHRDRRAPRPPSKPRRRVPRQKDRRPNSDLTASKP